MSGGYAPDVDAIVTIHTNTIREAVHSCRIRFRLLTEADVKAVLTMDDLDRDDGVRAAAFSARRGRAAGPHGDLRSTATTRSSA